MDAKSCYTHYIMKKFLEKINLWGNGNSESKAPTPEIISETKRTEIAQKAVTGYAQLIEKLGMEETYEMQELIRDLHIASGDPSKFLTIYKEYEVASAQLIGEVFPKAPVFAESETNISRFNKLSDYVCDIYTSYRKFLDNDTVAIRASQPYRAYTDYKNQMNTIASSFNQNNNIPDSEIVFLMGGASNLRKQLCQSVKSAICPEYEAVEEISKERLAAVQKAGTQKLSRTQTNADARIFEREQASLRLKNRVQRIAESMLTLSAMAAITYTGYNASSNYVATNPSPAEVKNPQPEKPTTLQPTNNTVQAAAPKPPLVSKIDKEKLDAIAAIPASRLPLDIDKLVTDLKKPTNPNVDAMPSDAVIKQAKTVLNLDNKQAGENPFAPSKYNPSPKSKSNNPASSIANPKPINPQFMSTEEVQGNFLQSQSPDNRFKPVSPGQLAKDYGVKQSATPLVIQSYKPIPGLGNTNPNTPFIIKTPETKIKKVDTSTTTSNSSKIIRDLLKKAGRQQFMPTTPDSTIHNTTPSTVEQAPTRLEKKDATIILETDVNGSRVFKFQNR
jgi:hypothetical protein